MCKPFCIPVAQMKPVTRAAMDGLKTSYYVRLVVVDKPGVLAGVTGVFRDEGISLSSFLQHGQSEGKPVQVVLTTHETLERSMKRALQSISKLDSVVEPPHMIRIEPL